MPRRVPYIVGVPTPLPLLPHQVGPAGAMPVFIRPSAASMLAHSAARSAPARIAAAGKAATKAAKAAMASRGSGMGYPPMRKRRSTRRK